jgi:hypothetical protein
VYRSFEKARIFAQKLKLRKEAEWRAFTKSGELPADIPATPSRVYKNKGWKGMRDWLGTVTTPPNPKKYRMFEEARTFAHSLQFESEKKWHEFSESGFMPDDIPSNPNETYNGKGWVGWDDWLGKKY